MRRGARVLPVIAVAMLGIGAAGGCGLIISSTHTDETVLSEDVSSVRMDGDNGDMTILGDPDTAEVTITRTLKYRGNLPEDPSFRVEEGVLVLDDCGRRCSVSYEVSLPAGVPVSGGTDNGAIALSQTGEADVRTANGDVRVDGASGPVNAITDNGKVVVSGATEAVSARTANGEVAITMDTPSDVVADTDNGRITVSVPDAAYRVSATTRNGELDIRVPNDPSGEYVLELSTDNGDVTLRTA